MVDVKCAGCGKAFEAKTSRAKWCEPACKMRTKRRGEKPAAEAKQLPPAGDDEGLVSAVRRELEVAGRLETIAGQLAVQLARKLAAVDASGVSGLSKELRAVLAEALEGTQPPPDPDDGVPDDDEGLPDEVAEARRRRDAARESAGRA